MPKNITATHFPAILHLFIIPPKKTSMIISFFNELRWWQSIKYWRAKLNLNNHPGNYYSPWYVMML